MCAGREGGEISNVKLRPLFSPCPLTFAQVDRLAALTGAGISIKTKGAVDGPEAATGVNFTRPECSPCLARFPDKNDPRPVEALALIREGRRVLYETTRADMSDFVLRNPVDLARDRRAAELRKTLEQTRRALVEGRRVADKP
jgi:hypothetical protein